MKLTIKQKKANLRQNLSVELENLPQKERELASEQICQNLFAFLQEKKAQIKHIGIYANTPTEPNISPLLQIAPEFTYYYPKCGKENALSWHQISDSKTLKKGAYGILEPVSAQHPEIPASSLEIILCPGAGFSPNGWRLGQGMGYYDRAFTIAKKALRIGIAYSCQLIPAEKALPEKHDIPVQAITTEKTPLPLFTPQ